MLLGDEQWAGVWPGHQQWVQWLHVIHYWVICGWNHALSCPFLRSCKTVALQATQSGVTIQSTSSSASPMACYGLKWNMLKTNTMHRNMCHFEPFQDMHVGFNFFFWELLCPQVLVILSQAYLFNFPTGHIAMPWIVPESHSQVVFAALRAQGKSVVACLL